MRRGEEGKKLKRREKSVTEPKAGEAREVREPQTAVE
jgi:hypothetical protein